MPTQTDLLIQSAQGEPILAVEVKNLMNLTAVVAQDFRHQLMDYASNGSFATPRFFMLASQDRGYIWGREQGEVKDAPPRSEFPMASVMSRYLPPELMGRRLREPDLEFLILRWFIDLTLGGYDESIEANRILHRLGIVQAIDSGSIVSGSVV